MRLLFLFAAVIGLNLCNGLSLLALEPTELNGTWIELIPPPSRVGYAVRIDPTKLVIEKTSMSELVGTTAIRQSLFTLPIKQGSSAIDFVTVVDGEFWHTRGVYKIEGDVLTISESTRDGDRPKDFRPTDVLSGHLVLVRSFQRVKSIANDDSSPANQRSKDISRQETPR
jgi:hypothetical protein